MERKSILNNNKPWLSFVVKGSENFKSVLAEAGEISSQISEHDLSNPQQEDQIRDDSSNNSSWRENIVYEKI